MNTTTQQQPAPFYGEPWKTEPGTHSISDTGDFNGYVELRTSQETRVAEVWNPDDELEAFFARIVSCVNACAGMEDPAAEIQAMREATEEAERALSNALFIHEAITPYAPQDAADKIENQKHCDNIKAALANLKPFIKP